MGGYVPVEDRYCDEGFRRRRARPDEGHDTGDERAGNQDVQGTCFVVIND